MLNADKAFYTDSDSELNISCFKFDGIGLYFSIYFNSLPIYLSTTPKLVSSAIHFESRLDAVATSVRRGRQPIYLK